MSFNVFSKKSNIGKKVKHQIIDTEPLEKLSPLQPYQPGPYVYEDVVRRHAFHMANGDAGRDVVIDEHLIAGKRVTSNHVGSRVPDLNLRIRANTNDKISTWRLADRNVIYAGRGNDYAEFYSGNQNVIYLEEGDDVGVVRGFHGSNFNTFHGGTGNDHLTGSTFSREPAMLYGGQDDDTLIGHVPGTQLFGDEGDDVLELAMAFDLNRTGLPIPGYIYASGGPGRDSFIVDVSKTTGCEYFIRDFSRDDQLIFKNGVNARDRLERSSFTYEVIEEDRVHVFYDDNLYAKVHLQGWTVFDDDFSTRGGGDGVDLAFGAHGNVPRVMDQEGNMR